jgi:hypothetical protein
MTCVKRTVAAMTVMQRGTVSKYCLGSAFTIDRVVM